MSSKYKHGVTHSAGDSRHWIGGAIGKPGALRKTMGVKAGQTIPVGRLQAAAKGNSKTAKRARLALTLRRMNSK